MNKLIQIKDHQYQLMIDIQKKQIVISKKNVLHFYYHKIIPFSQIKKIIFELKNGSIYFHIQTTDKKVYSTSILLNDLDENDFIIFLMFLKKSQLDIEDQEHIINHILENDQYLEKLC